MTVYVNDDEVTLQGEPRLVMARSIIAAHGAQHPALALAPPDRYYLERLPPRADGSTRPIWRGDDRVHVRNFDRFAAVGTWGGSK